MKSRRATVSGCGVLLTVMMGLGLGGTETRADALYGITDLGTLSGQPSSVATGINNNGQVVGISYNSSNGSFGANVFVPAGPPRFDQTGSGAESFLYSNGQMSQINPTDGLAMSINNSGQVVGGDYVSINSSGQYVGGGGAGVYPGNENMPNQLVSGGTTTVMQLMPFGINDNGEVAGAVTAGGAFHAGFYQNGQLTDLYSLLGSYSIGSMAVAINQQGDLLITAGTAPGGQSWLYHADNGTLTNLSALPGGSAFIGAALNNNDQAVGGGLLYSNGTIQALLSLVPPNSGWSNLNATGINDAGQIVGQGTYDGQQVAFLMSPDAVPEPGTLAIWGLTVSCAGYRIWRGCPTMPGAAK